MTQAVSQHRIQEMSMNQLQTTRKFVFDFDAAVKQGMARDQHMNKHVIRGNGEQFIITFGNEEEHCFNRDGKQFSQFPKLKLTEPCKVEVKLLPYLIYNARTMAIVDQANGAMEGLALADAQGDPDVTCINVTHPLNRPLLADLGITAHRWYEQA
jgi:hypothetical protein